VQRDADRDRAIERMLRRSGSTAGPESASCLDAETLAAWGDGGLSPAQAASVEQHVSDCSRCTALLAMLVRTTPVVPAAAESAWRKWRLPWLVPIATAATAVALWVAIPRNQQTVAPATESTVATQAPAPLPQQEATPLSAAEEKRVASPAPPSTAGDVDRRSTTAKRESRADRANEPVDERTRTEIETFAPAVPQAAPREADQKTANFEAAAGAAVPAAPAAAPPATASPGAAASAAPAPPATRRAEGRLAQTADQNAAFARTVPQLQVVSPDPAKRWRVVGPGRVERSINGGAQWEPAILPESATLTAGMSPAPSVCWLVGRTGAIYVTSDGLRFIRIPFPERTDFVSIQATDDRHATVITIDGRTFRTDDQGVTWVRVGP
jgi:hypothetical protein